MCRSTTNVQMYEPGTLLANMSDGFHKLFRLKRIIKGKLTASDAAIHVVGGSGNKEAWFSRHGMPPMRGRDNQIVLSRRHKSTMSQCDLWHPCGTHVAPMNGAI